MSPWAEVALAAGRLRLELAPRLGGSVAAFWLTGARSFALLRPLLAPPAPEVPALGAAMFPMLPFANCIRDNQFRFAGGRYGVSPNMPGAHLNYHGSGWHRPWRAEASSEAEAILYLEENGCASPWRFCARQRFALTPHTLTVETSLTNTGSNPMPFSFGQHPWFSRHGEAVVRFQAARWIEEDDAGHAAGEHPVGPLESFSGGRPMPRCRLNRCYAGWVETAVQKSARVAA